MKTDIDILYHIQCLTEESLTIDTFLQKVVSLLHAERPCFNWVGIYLLKNNLLEIGPYVGKPTPHTHIPLNTGICGAAASTGQTIIVDDVQSDSRYLACSIETKSEIVVPIIYNGQILGEIDIDSDKQAAFTEADKQLLESIAPLIGIQLGMRS